MTEITAISTGLPGRLRRRLARPAAAPSLRAQIALLVSAFLLGGVVSALLFVGVWRHTAAEGDRARAAQVETHQALAEAQARLARTEQELGRAQHALAVARSEGRSLAQQLGARRRIDARAAKALTPRLQDLSTGADGLGRSTAKLGSALASLRDYLRNASATGVDPSFLEAQVAYLVGAAGAARSSAVTLAADARSANTAASALRQKH